MDPLRENDEINGGLQIECSIHLKMTCALMWEDLEKYYWIDNTNFRMLHRVWHCLCEQIPIYAHALAQRKPLTQTWFFAGVVSHGTPDGGGPGVMGSPGRWNIFLE